MRLMLSGNEAAARGAWEAGVKVAAAYPGTPSTEILETIAREYAGDIRAEWSPNEKVAFEVGVGASMAGARSLVCMKHVGLNVAADPFMTFAYTGVKGGFVVVSADDPGMHSSQNEQDNRYYARLALVPVIEPSDSQETLDFMVRSFEISEQFDTPVLFRMVTRVSHSKTVVTWGDRAEKPVSGFAKDPQKFVMVPAHARMRRRFVLDRLKKLAEFAETTPLNRVEPGSAEIGVITSGVSYHYAKEVLPDASFLRLGLGFPLPEKKIRDFAASVRRLFVIEELEPFIEDQVKALGIACEGKKRFTAMGELSPNEVEKGFAAAGVIESKAHSGFKPEPMFPRPPVLCPGCPHRGIYAALKKLRVPVTGDIGCYTLGALKPLEVMDTCVCMGASIGNAVGMAMAGAAKKGVVAAIGDSTFLHSGMTGLLDAVYKNADVTVLILDNRITAMTGGQDHPGTGRTLSGDPSEKVDLAAVCRALGVKSVKVVDPYDLDESGKALRESLGQSGPSVVITNRPCVLMPRKIKETPYRVEPEDCTGCGVCMRLGCPAILASPEKTDKGKNKSVIDQDLCAGCSVCAQVCPSKCISRAGSPKSVGAAGR